MRDIPESRSRTESDGQVFNVYSFDRSAHISSPASLLLTLCSQIHSHHYAFADM